jgi:protein-S-isoprenylcysteine O-methyltransferase Ste14
MTAGLLLVWLLAPAYHLDTRNLFPYAPLLPCLAIVLVIAAAEWAVPQLRAPAPDAIAREALRPLDLGRVGLRLFALAATLALVAAAYWLLPEYSGDFYAPYWQFLRTLAPVGVLVPFYFIWADRRLQSPEDEYLAFGTWLRSGLRTADWPLIRNHLCGWTVKAYFLPLMAVYLSDELRSLYNAFANFRPETMPVYEVFYHLSYGVDLLFCVVGYSASIRLFGSQIRSVEPTVAGWLVALICYQPFYSVIGKFYLQYDDDIYWDNWLQAWPAIRAFWGILIVVLSSIYALCTVSFGLRFSNLTNRGIITGGPYRFSKHPAYLAKNLSWWLVSVPFISNQGWSAGLRNSCLLALLNLVYYARARTEERHLSRDPAYVAYALWINENGLLRGLARMFPVLGYRAPARTEEGPT